MRVNDRQPAERDVADERPGWVILLTVCLVVAVLSGLLTRDGAGALYFLVYLAVALPGLPVGLRLLGRNPLGVAAGAVIGYGLSCLATWAVIEAGHPSAAAFVGAWALLLAACWAVFYRPRPAALVTLPVFRRRDTHALLLVLALVALTIAIPYRHLGTTDAQGDRLYRAYFTADFWWHTALTSELSKFDMPPVNPYLAPERMHYYWTYFLVPAATVGAGPRALASPSEVLKTNALCTALVFTTLFFGLAWLAVRRRWPLLAGVTLALYASSGEGLYEVWQVWKAGRPLSILREMNIDAVTAWVFDGLRIDSLLRSMWYNPQHTTSVALSLVALVVAAAAGSAASWSAALLAGLSLGLSATLNPFIGSVFLAIYAVVVLADALGTPRDLPTRVLRLFVTALPVAAALAWCVFNSMVEGAGGVLRIGIDGPAWKAPVVGLVLSLGPVVVAAVLGLAWRPWRLARAYWPSLAGMVLAIALMYLLWLSVDSSWVGFRAGQVFLVSAPAMVGLFFDKLARLPRGGAVATSVFVLLAAAGLPTAVIDGYNAQDVTNRAMGPGFRWTIPVSPDQQAALEWIRRMTPRSAIVQFEPVTRARDTWSLIASFGQRRMAAGEPLPLMGTPEYTRRMREVQTIYATADAGEAWRTAKRLAIDYLYVDGAEREAYVGPGVDKFAASPEYFAPVFQRGDVAIYAVNR